MNSNYSLYSNPVLGIIIEMTELLSMNYKHYARIISSVSWNYLNDFNWYKKIELLIEQVCKLNIVTFLGFLPSRHR